VTELGADVGDRGAGSQEQAGVGVAEVVEPEVWQPRGLPGGVPGLRAARRVVRGLREVAEAGAEPILLNPVFDEAEQMERLVAEVVPKLS
jgi:hypothetical protein